MTRGKHGEYRVEGKFPQSIQREAFSPPGAGRNFFGDTETAVKSLFHRAFRISRRDRSRQVAAERGANTRQSGGEYTGNNLDSFPGAGR